MRLGPPRLVSAALAGLVLACGPGREDPPDADPQEDPRERCYPLIEFADPRLEAQVKHRLDLPDVPLSVLEIEAVWWWQHADASYGSTTLWDIDGADLYGIRDLEGIQCLPLTKISCADCPITSLAPLAGMPELESLIITGADALDLGPLSRLTELREVSLRDAGIHGADALLGGDAAFPELESLDLAGNQISAIDGAAQLPALTRLDLTGNALRQAPEVSGMPALRELLLDDNPLADLAPLADARELQQLSAENAELTSLAPLAALPLLSTLHVGGNRLTTAGDVPAAVHTLSLDRNPLASLAGLGPRTLRRLDASECGLTTTAGLEDVRIERELDLHGNAIRRPAGIHRLADVIGLRLDLSDNPVDDLSGLSSLSSEGELTLDLSATALTDLTTAPPLLLAELRVAGGALESLAGFGSLTLRPYALIDVSANPLSDIAPLADIDVERLTVNLDDTQVSDITPLASASVSVLEVSASRTRVQDLAQVLQFDNFNEFALLLDGNGITDASALAEPGSLLRLSLRDNAISSFPPVLLVMEPGSLDLSGNAIAALPDFGPQGSVGPSYLSLADNALTSLAPLEAAVGNLGFLDVSDNAIAEVPPLANLTIRRLDLSGNPLTSVGAIPWLRDFSCARCGLTDLDVLAPILPTLYSLDVADNPLSDLGPLAAAADLQVLTLSGVLGLDFSAISWLRDQLYLLVAVGCDITDLTPFTGISSLDLRDNAIRDLTPLRDLSRDTSGEDGIDLRGNPIDVDSILGIYDLCLNDATKIRWDDGICEESPNYES